MSAKPVKPAKPIEVEIYGQRYSIGGETEESVAKEAARYVDAKMRDVAAKAKDTTPSRLALLVALNIAVDLVHAQRSRSRGRDEPDEDVARWARHLTGVLDAHLLHLPRD